MVPTIGTTGAFTLIAPYNTIINPAQQLTVVATRSIPELQASGEDPFNTIYAPVGISDVVFAKDIADNVPIVTLKTDGDSYVYIPANMIVSIAKLSGYKYVEKSLIINLGHLPQNTDTALIEQLVKDDIYNSLGVVPTITPADTSAVVYVPKPKHDTLTNTRANIATVSKSYQTRYQELLTLYTAQQQLLANIETVYRTKGIGA